MTPKQKAAQIYDQYWSDVHKKPVSKQDPLPDIRPLIEKALIEASTANAGLLAAAEKCEQLLMAYGDPWNGDDYQAVQDVRAAIKNAREDAAISRGADAIKLIEELTGALEDLGNWLAYGIEKPDGAEVTAEDERHCSEVAEKAGEAVAKGQNFLGVAEPPTFPSRVKKALAS